MIRLQIIKKEIEEEENAKERTPFRMAQLKATLEYLKSKLAK